MHAASRFDAAKTSLDPKPIETIIGAPVETDASVFAGRSQQSTFFIFQRDGE
jgi:hypothetical protein